MRGQGGEEGRGGELEDSGICRFSRAEGDVQGLRGLLRSLRAM